MVHISHFLGHRPLNQSAQPGELRASCNPLTEHSGVSWEPPPTACP